MYISKHFSAVTKAGLDSVDWRVPRTNYCLDPKYNADIPREIAPNVIAAKRKDGRILEHELGEEAIAKWAEELKEQNMSPPPPEVILRPGAAFLEVQKGYSKEEDSWEMALELRPLDDAMEGDITKPLPRPLLNPGDFESFREGRYLKDDCPIA
jgi:hypothetical protein